MHKRLASVVVVFVAVFTAVPLIAMGHKRFRQYRQQMAVEAAAEQARLAAENAKQEEHRRKIGETTALVGSAVDKVIADRRLPLESILDSWSNPLKFTVSNGKVSRSIKVESAGPDERLYTSDDIVATRIGYPSWWPLR